MAVWKSGWASYNSAEVLSTSYKNFVNFGPLTPEFTVMVWRPFMRQMGEISETRSILGNRIPQRMAGTAERICAKFTQKTCLVLRSYEFQYQDQGSKSPGTKNALRTPNTPAVLTEWNAVVADNVAQAANATSQSLVRSVFAGLRIVRAACGRHGGLPLGSATHF